MQTAWQNEKKEDLKEGGSGREEEGKCQWWSDNEGWQQSAVEAKNSRQQPLMEKAKQLPPKKAMKSQHLRSPAAPKQ